jgi:NADH dehydrogenase
VVAAVARSLGLEVDRGGRLGVEPDLSLPGHPEILVLGDAAVRIGRARRPWPGVAPVAMQQGAHVGAVIRARLAGRPAPPFRYHDRGNLATIGTGAAVADLGRIRFSGFVAWVLWIFVHIGYLVEFQNRVLVLTQWAWAFFTRGRSSLLITQEASRGADHRGSGSTD